MNPSPRNPFAALRRFARPEAPAERCGLCGAALGPEHDHLAEPAARKLVCACPACALLFGAQEARRYRRVPPRLEALPAPQVSDGEWAELGAPVGLAFFYRSGATGGVVAVYPSPAGPLESPVGADAWHPLATRVPRLADLEPDVEALLVNRTNGAGDYFRCSIDRCYHLIGLVRAHWRGFSGGPDVWREVEDFFARLRAEAEPKAGTPL